MNDPLHDKATKIAYDYIRYMNDNFGITVDSPTIILERTNEYVVTWRKTGYAIALYVTDKSSHEINLEFVDWLKSFKI